MKRSHNPRSSRDEAVEATAAAWLAQQDAGFTPEEARDFARWCASDPDHEVAVARLESAWAALQGLRNFRPEARMHPDPDLLRTGRPSRRPLSFAAFAKVATAAVLVLVATWGVVRPTLPSNLSQQDYTSAVDGYERMMLPDGSIFELNSNSAVSVSFTSAERRVRLVQGEAHFTVAKDSKRPFLVDAGTVSIRATGTAFNVRLRPDNVEVLVTQGTVKVDRYDQPLADGRNPFGNSRRKPALIPDSPSRPLASPHVLLSAGQRTVISRTVMSAPVIDAVAPEAIRETLAWQAPRLVFVDTPLSEVVAQFNRRNHVKLLLGDEELGRLPIGGSFRAENLDAFVRLLATDEDIIVERTHSTLIVLHRALEAHNPE